jgi:hypothetical protein
MSGLPKLKSKEFDQTRNYLREVALCLGSLQRVFLKSDIHLWQHGLQVSMRGLVTQPFEVNGKPTHASLDLVRYKVRLSDKNWALYDNSPKDIYDGIQLWLEDNGISKQMEEPNFEAGEILFDTYQVDKYAEALWWSDMHFKDIAKTLKQGLTSPVYLYPHHFDLSLTWYPFKDDRQISLGFSASDNVSSEAYYYLSAYPEPKKISGLSMPKQARYSNKDFSGWILNYEDVSTDSKLLDKFTELKIAAQQLK